MQNMIKHWLVTQCILLQWQQKKNFSQLCALKSAHTRVLTHKMCVMQSSYTDTKL